MADRNLNPTAEAILAMAMWGKLYVAFRGGSMDFWDSLSDSDRRLCSDLYEDMRDADRRHGRHQSERKSTP